MNCPALVQLVTEYLEGAMLTEDVARFEEHLQRCPPCEVYLVQIRRTIEVCGKLPAEAIPDDAKATLMAAFEDWKVAR
jgi:anti-sigma factor RsiW